jgi:hypothetical protein
LQSVGIVQTWRSTDLNGKTTVTCILEGFGHTKEGSTLSGPADTSGGKNSIQAIGSTSTYLQRYTLLMTCGIVARGTDDDGKTEGMSEDAIADYAIQMQDDSNFDDLKKHFAECGKRRRKPMTARQWIVFARSTRRERGNCYERTRHTGMAGRTCRACDCIAYLGGEGEAAEQGTERSHHPRQLPSATHLRSSLRESHRG